MADKEREVIEIDNCYTSSDQDDTDLRSILCVKNSDQIEKLEKKEDCFILGFDPYIDIDIKNLSLSKGFNDAGAVDLSILAEKGQVACRDYPHSRHTCAKYPFDKTPHDSRCKLCYCYVCDSAAPCEKWAGSSGHCHAFNTEYWNKKRKERKMKVARRDSTHFRHTCPKYPFQETHHDSHCRLCYCYVCDAPAPCEKWTGSSVARRDRPHFRHQCAKYPFDRTPHDTHCKLCYCYVCDSAAPCQKWLGSSAHCHAFNTGSWRRKRHERRY